MSATLFHPHAATATAADATPIVITRTRVDRILIAFGALAAVVLVVAGSLLTWGASFARDYVGDELSSQQITFPSAEALTTEGRTDLLPFAGQFVDTGREAEAYASYIDGHLQGIADGKTYSELGAVERAANAAVDEAVTAGQPQASVDELQATADQVTAQRNTLFKGETLRGLLLSAFAWSTVGAIAGIAAIAVFVAGGLALILVLAGLWHLRRMHHHGVTS
jgi:hypothetical protein